MAAVDELACQTLEGTLPVSKPTISYHTKNLIPGRAHQRPEIRAELFLLAAPRRPARGTRQAVGARPDPAAGRGHEEGLPGGRAPAEARGRSSLRRLVSASAPRERDGRGSSCPDLVAAPAQTQLGPEAGRARSRSASRPRSSAGGGAERILGGAFPSRMRPAGNRRGSSDPRRTPRRRRSRPGCGAAAASAKAGDRPCGSRAGCAETGRPRLDIPSPAAITGGRHRRPTGGAHPTSAQIGYNDPLDLSRLISLKRAIVRPVHSKGPRVGSRTGWLPSWVLAGRGGVLLAVGVAACDRLQSPARVRRDE